LASGSWDSTILLWDAASWPESRRKGAQLSAKELENLWQTLGELNAAEVFRAIWQLADDPERSLPWINAKLQVISFPLLDQIRRWLDNLDNDVFAKREEAARKLTEAGHMAEFSIGKALSEKRSLEFKVRATKLLQELQTKPIRPDLLRVRRSLQVLEAIGTPEAAKMIEDLQRNLAEAPQASQRLFKREISSK
jgi:hypothetical protein